MTKMKTQLLAGVAAVLATGAIVGAAYADEVLDRMKADIARSVGPQTTWDGPTTGPKAMKDKSIVYVSLTQNSSGNADSARGAEEAAGVLGWKFTLMDGKGTATGGADALAQAIALKPDAIILVHGGPVAEPADAEFVIKTSRHCHGFYGASSMERLPVETALTEQTRRFKAIKR